MKKVYKKPTIAIESFALTQSIAVSCGYTDDQFQGHPTQADKPVCGWDNGWGRFIGIPVTRTLTVI